VHGGAAWYTAAVSADCRESISWCFVLSTGNWSATCCSLHPEWVLLVSTYSDQGALGRDWFPRLSSRDVLSHLCLGCKVSPLAWFRCFRCPGGWRRWLLYSLALSLLCVGPGTLASGVHASIRRPGPDRPIAPRNRHALSV